MAIKEIMASIDRDIAKLQQARSLLQDEVARTGKKKAGRPKKPAIAPKRVVVAAVPLAKPANKKRKLSPEGRKRIVEALKKRWAAKKVGAAKPASALTK